MTAAEIICIRIQDINELVNSGAIRRCPTHDSLVEKQWAAGKDQIDHWRRLPVLLGEIEQFHALDPSIPHVVDHNFVFGVVVLLRRDSINEP